MTEVRVIPVVQTTLTKRGDGTHEAPIRAVTQYWSLDGEFLAENDPVNPPFHFASNKIFKGDL